MQSSEHNQFPFKVVFMDQFDVIVIGAGLGGYVCAIRASQLGLKIAIVEKQWLGGVCLNVGCIPSKSLLRNAELAHILHERAADFGFSFDNLSLDYSAAVKRSRQVSDRLTKGVAFLLRKNQITVFTGAARLLSHKTVEITDAENNKTTLTANNIVIATGAHASAIPGISVDGKRILSYKEAILQPTLPKSVVVIGAGAIGVEFSTIWSSYGTHVTLIEMLPRIVPLEDEEVSTELAKSFQKHGVDVFTGAKVQSIQTLEDHASVKFTIGEEEKVVAAEQVLIATGFKPNSLELGLEEAGIELDSRKFVKIDETMATNVPGFWAVGDVTGQLLLAHVASAQGIVCAENIAGLKTEPLNYTMIPRVTYSNPQIASFGLTETQVKAQGTEYKIGHFNFIANGKALSIGENAGFTKIIINSTTERILGAHLIGADVSELLPELTLASQNDLSIEAISRNIHAHPTLSEAVLDAANAALGKSIQS
jgi:dihydrolipoamide dehydrogenase